MPYMIHRRPIVWLLAVVWLQQAHAGKPSLETAQQWCERGMKAFDGGRYEAARDYFQEALKRAPASALPLWGLARSEAKLDRCIEAEQHGDLFLKHTNIRSDHRAEITEIVNKCHLRRLAADRAEEEKRLAAAKPAEAPRTEVTPPEKESPKPPSPPVESPPPMTEPPHVRTVPAESLSPVIAPKPPDTVTSTGRTLRITGITLFVAGAAIAIGGGVGLQKISGEAAVATGTLGGAIAVGGTVLFGPGQRRLQASQPTSWILVPTIAAGSAGIAAIGSF